MIKAPKCISCQSPMELKEVIHATEKRRYNINRFHCDLCDYSETVYAANEVNDNIDRMAAIRYERINMRNKLEKQEEQP